MAEPGQIETEPPTVVFGLTKEQLLPILESIVKETIVSFDVSIENELQGHKGYGGEKLIPTFSYVSRSGSEGEITVFIKVERSDDRPSLNRHTPECEHYRHLMEINAPIPVFHEMLKAKDRSLIFIEYVEATCDIHPFTSYLRDAVAFREFLSLAASINAIEPTDTYRHVLPHFDLTKRIGDVPGTLGQIWEHALSDKLGSDLRDFCVESMGRIATLETLSDGLASRVRLMPEGLCHSDFYPDHTGRRVGTGELLLLDLESMAFAPRFSDVGLWLGAPEEALPLAHRGELVEHYLREYHRWGKPDIGAEEFMEEARVVWQIRTLGMLDFTLRRALDGVVDWTGDRDEGRQVYRRDLQQSLRGLLSTGL